MKNISNRISTITGSILLTISLFISLFLIFSSANKLDSISISSNYFPPAHTQLAQISGSGSGLVAHYTFDEGSGTTAGDSAGSNSGTLINNPAWVSGKIGQGLSFDGVDDYITVSHNAVLNPSEITISFWVNLKSQPANNNFGFIDKNSAIGYRIRCGNVNPCIPQFSFNAVTGASGSGISLNNWTHIVLVGNSNGTRFYTNATAGILDTDAYVAGATTGSLIMGKTLGPINAIFDDVRIYNRALSATEIGELYALGETGVLPPDPDPILPPDPIIPPVIPPETTTESGTCTSITQYGITWTFDRAYTCGKFANDDWWVAGSEVIITTITPDFNGVHNGWEVNPRASNRQGFDAGGGYGGWDASRVPTLPYVAMPGQSIIKGLSYIQDSNNTLNCYNNPPAGTSCLETAAVLTVVGADNIPPGNGSEVFRPPYIGTDKPYYYINNLRLSLLPSLAPVGSNVPSLLTVENRAKRVQLEHIMGPEARTIRPALNLPDYGGSIAIYNNEAALRLMLNDPISAKMPALIAFVQGGIDRYHAILNGQTWPSGPGHEPGHKISVAFAAALLNDTGMKNAVSNSTFFNEDKLIQLGYNDRAIFGETRNASEGKYWDYTSSTQATSLEYYDPYGFIDGGMNEAHANGYQVSVLGQPWKISSLAARLMPEISSIWNSSKFFDYTDRYVTLGLWTQPDPCAPASQGGGSNGNGGCILDPDLVLGSTIQNFSCQVGKECGRFPKLHATFKDGLGYTSRFGNDMWTAYRNAPPPLDSDLDLIPDSTDLCPLTPVAMRSFVNTYGCPKPKAVNFTIKPDFDSLDLRSVSSLELGTTQGRIIFLDPVVLLKDRTTYKDQLDLDSNITITNNRVVINSTSAPELNKRATITLSNLTFINPKILKDGITCTTCTIYTYTNGTLVFTVPGFSTYEAAETTPNTPTTPTAPAGTPVPGRSGGGGNTNTQDTSNPSQSSGPSAQTITSNQCTSNSSGYFTTSLTTGATGESVRQLQIFLNSKGFTVSTTGGGSRGNETTYFGPATTRALAAFQAANNITPAVGFFGPLTRAKVNSLNTTATGSTCPPTVIPTISSPSTFTRNLSMGMTGNDVKALQIYLNSKGFTVSTSGGGSPGNETTYFGPATKAALIRFQEANRSTILTPNGLTSGTGIFGPSTRGVVAGGR